MQEAVYKLKIQKFDKALQLLLSHADDLTSQEQEAIATLCNMWRKASFSPDTTRRVERQIKLLVDSDKYHSNNRDIIQASKDVRGVFKEMYTTDAETFKQFSDFCQKAFGGPRMTNEQQQHQTPSTPAPPRPTSTTSRPTTSTTSRPTSTTSRPTSTTSRPTSTTSRPTQSSYTSSGSSGNGGSGFWGYIIALLLLLGIGGGLYYVWQHFMGEGRAEMTYELKGNWNGELQGAPMTLIVDDVEGDSVFGRVIVKWRRSVDRHSVKGVIDTRSDDHTLSLQDQDAGQGNLNGDYVLVIHPDATNVMNGTYTNRSTQNSFNITLKQEKAAAPAEEVAPATRPAKQNPQAETPARPAESHTQAPPVKEVVPEEEQPQDGGGIHLVPATEEEQRMLNNTH